MMVAGDICSMSLSETLKSLQHASTRGHHGTRFLYKKLIYIGARALPFCSGNALGDGFPVGALTNFAGCAIVTRRTLAKTHMISPLNQGGPWNLLKAWKKAPVPSTLFSQSLVACLNTGCAWMCCTPWTWEWQPGWQGLSSTLGLFHLVPRNRTGQKIQPRSGPCLKKRTKILASKRSSTT